MRSCAGCEAVLPVVSGRGRPRTYCEACRPTDIANRAAASARYYRLKAEQGDGRAPAEYVERMWAHRMARSPKGCLDCGASVQRGREFRYCEPCSDERRRSTNRRRNAKRRGAVRLERFTLAEIGERDGWACHLCSRRVDRSLSGRERFGPTIDHLVPLSCGGTDERVNVALAHRECNVRRHVGGEVQLRLVG